MTFRCISSMVSQDHDPIDVDDITDLAGMNDVLPKPFTKEGLVSMLDKHLSHLKKNPAGLDPMGAPPAPLSAGPKRVLKTEDSPATSPAAASNWNSPGTFSGVSPASNQTDEQSIYSQGPYAVQQGYQPGPPMYNPAQRPQPPQAQPHRRGIGEISGGPGEMGGDPKRQHMYAPTSSMGQPVQQPLQPMQRPPR